MGTFSQQPPDRPHINLAAAESVLLRDLDIDHPTCAVSLLISVGLSRRGATGDERPHKIGSKFDPLRATGA